MSITRYADTDYVDDKFEEVKDIRKGFDNTVYENAGTAVREQFSKLNNKIETLTIASVTRDENGKVTLSL